MVVPTLAADSRLQECVESLGRQTRRDFEVIVVDNSGTGLVRENGTAPGARVIENARNAGFGGAVNQGMRASTSPYVATLNDDAVAHPDWLEALVAALERRPDAGMCARQVRLFGETRLDSAGMLMARDGSSKQRGHGRPPEDFPVAEEALLPSGSAALYRRAMLEEIGGFDDDFFLYCEDTDLGLRARWAGWKCLYVPQAMVEHHYSHSAGRAIAAEGVLRGAQPAVRAGEEFSGRNAGWRRRWRRWRATGGTRGFCCRAGERGAVPRGRKRGAEMAWYIVRAHAALLGNAGTAVAAAAADPAARADHAGGFRRLMRGHSISARKVAEL